MAQLDLLQAYFSRKFASLLESISKILKTKNAPNSSITSPKMCQSTQSSSSARERIVHTSPVYIHPTGHEPHKSLECPLKTGWSNVRAHKCTDSPSNSGADPVVTPTTRKKRSHSKRQNFRLSEKYVVNTRFCGPFASAKPLHRINLAVFITIRIGAPLADIYVPYTTNGIRQSGSQ